MRAALPYSAQVLPVWWSRQQPINGWSHYYPTASTAIEGDMHALFEVGVMFAGVRESYFQDWVVELRPGDVWLNPGWEAHGWRYPMADTRDLVVMFRPDFLGDERFGDLSWLSLFAVPPRDRPRVTSEPMRQHVLALARELAAEVDEKPEAWLAGARQCLLRLLLTLRRGWQPPRAARTSHLTAPALERIMPAIELTCRRLSQRVTVEEAAAACALSETQFRFLFRQTMAVTFGQFATRTRLAHAAHLLGSTEMTAQAVAAQTGFTDASHLNRLLLRVHGHTATGYRKQGGREEPVANTGTARGLSPP